MLTEENHHHNTKHHVAILRVVLCKCQVCFEMVMFTPCLWLKYPLRPPSKKLYSCMASQFTCPVTCFTLEYLTTIGWWWLDWQMSPDPPSTSWWVVSGWNFPLEWTSHLSLTANPAPRVMVALSTISRVRRQVNRQFIAGPTLTPTNNLACLWTGRRPEHPRRHKENIPPEGPGWNPRFRHLATPSSCRPAARAPTPLNGKQLCEYSALQCTRGDTWGCVHVRLEKQKPLD